MLNFFGFYLDPVYVLILTVIIVFVGMYIMARYMKQMADTLNKTLAEVRKSEATRVADEAQANQTAELIAALEAQTKELKEHLHR